MKKTLIIISLLTLALITPIYAYRISKPSKITDFNENNLVILNDALEELWNVTNGRYTLDVITSNPDGTISGQKGDMILYDAGANEYLEINIDGGTTWKGVQITDTP